MCYRCICSSPANVDGNQLLPGEFECVRPVAGRSQLFLQLRLHAEQRLAVWGGLLSHQQLRGQCDCGGQRFHTHRYFFRQVLQHPLLFFYSIA